MRGVDCLDESFGVGWPVGGEVADEVGHIVVLAYLVAGGGVEREDDFRHMYASQGQMLMLLMSRETDHTSYDLIKQYRGKASANWWQFVAKLFKNDLKEEYDSNDKDAIIERVIHLVEAGQL